MCSTTQNPLVQATMLISWVMVGLYWSRSVQQKIDEIDAEARKVKGQKKPAQFTGVTLYSLEMRKHMHLEIGYVQDLWAEDGGMRHAMRTGGLCDRADLLSSRKHALKDECLALMGQHMSMICSHFAARTRVITGKATAPGAKPQPPASYMLGKRYIFAVFVHPGDQVVDSSDNSSDSDAKESSGSGECVDESSEEDSGDQQDVGDKQPPQDDTESDGTAEVVTGKPARKQKEVAPKEVSGKVPPAKAAAAKRQKKKTEELDGSEEEEDESEEPQPKPKRKPRCVGLFVVCSTPHREAFHVQTCDTRCTCLAGGL